MIEPAPVHHVSPAEDATCESPVVESARQNALAARRELSESLRGMSDSSERLWRQSRPVLILAFAGAGALAAVLVARSLRNRRSLRLSIARPRRPSALRAALSNVASLVARRAVTTLADRYLQEREAHEALPSAKAEGDSAGLPSNVGAASEG